MGLPNFLEQGDAVGVGETQVEHQDVGVQLVQLAQGFGAGSGEPHLITAGEIALVRRVEGLLVLHEQHLAAPARRRG